MRIENIKEENSEYFSFTFLFHFFYYLLECPLVNIQPWKDSQIMDLSMNLDTPKVMFCSVQVLNTSSSWFCFLVIWVFLQKKKEKKKMEEVYVTVLIKNKAKQ